jgi:hypothetical protein
MTDVDYEVGRLAVEDVLVERREARISMLRGNGLVIAEKDGKPSPVIRMGMEEALKIAYEAARKSHDTMSMVELASDVDARLNLMSHDHLELQKHIDELIAFLTKKKSITDGD